MALALSPGLPGAGFPDLMAPPAVGRLLRAAAALLLLATVCCAASSSPLVLEEGTGEGVPLRLGERFALDALGPLVVHADCTVHRITSWDGLSPGEQAVARRRIAERNAERLAACKELTHLHGGGEGEL